MDLTLTEEQGLLQHTAHEFVTGRSSLKRIRQLRDEDDPDRFSRTLWREMAELGWVGIVVPEKFGGAGLGYADLVVIMEELGRGLMPEPMISTALVGAAALLLGGKDRQQRDHLPALAAGERLFALAFQERRSRYDACHVKTSAEAANGGWVLTGEKVHVLDGHVADGLIVSARTTGQVGDADGITMFLVKADAPGVTTEVQTRIDDRRVATVRLASVDVGQDAVMGQIGGGGALLQRILDRAAIGLAAEMLGSMAAAFEMTMDYIKTRKQFGVPVGSFQALKHRAALMYMEMELTRSAVMAASRTVDDSGDDAAVGRAASIAKARASDAFMLIGNEGIQMHGGIGMTDEHDIGFFLKRARATEMTFGDAAYHRDRMARIDGY